MSVNVQNMPKGIAALVTTAARRKPAEARPGSRLAPPSHRPTEPQESPVSTPKSTRSRPPFPVRSVYFVTNILGGSIFWAALFLRARSIQLAYFGKWFAVVYWKGEQFISAHVHGVVTASIRDDRRAVCADCSERRSINGHERCNAMGCKTMGSSCPMWRYWVFTYLGWLQWLDGYGCKLRKWDNIKAPEFVQVGVFRHAGR